MAELYPVDNDYPDQFKIPPANRIAHPGTQTLFRQSTGFEKALADTDAERLMDVYVEAIIDEWNPWQVAYEHLPFLAWAQGVNLWEDWWDETFRRSWVARQWYLKSIRGKRAGLDEFVAAVGGHVKRCIVPPATAYGTKAMTDEERAAYVARFPQLRIYPYVGRSLLPWLCYNGVHWNGTGQKRVWNKNGSFLGPRWKMFPTVQTAGGKYTRTAVLYEPRTGVETKLTIRRIVKINTGPNAGWGFTPGVSQYDESVILPLEHRPNYFIGENKKYLCGRGDLGIFLGKQLPLRVISLSRSGLMDLVQAKAQYQTILPQEELLQVRPEYVSIKHPRRKTELYACRGEYLIRARSIVTHAMASSLVTGPPYFGRALYGMHANPFILGHPVFGAPVLTPSGATDPYTTTWVSNVGLIGGSVSDARKNLVNNLIVGLKTDGIWPKIDRLWLEAAENQQSARVDLKVGITPAVAVGSPGFTPNAGFACDGTNYINLVYNAALDGVLFTQDAGHLAAWNLDNTVSANPIVTDIPANNLHIYPMFTDNRMYGRINEGFSAGTIISDPRGFLLANRINSGSQKMYQNGIEIGSNSAASGARHNAPIAHFTRTCSCVSIGGSLSATEQLAFYNRLNTYMTAIASPTFSSPLDLPGLVAWYSADVGVYSDVGMTTLATNGQAVARWADRSGHSYHLIPGANPPTYGATGFNGRKTVNFPAATQGFVTTTSSVAMGTGNVASGFIVGQMLAGTGTYARGISYAAGVLADHDNVGSACIILSPPTGYIGAYRAGTQLASQAVAAATNYRMGSIFDSVNNTIYLNNVATVPSVASTGNFASPGRIIVGYDAAGGASWVGPMSEIVITNTALNSTQRTDLDNYFKTKWGL